MSPPPSTELAVVGGGPGGYAAAFRAAALGLDVTLIDPEPAPGGECLYRGCIPSKALLHVARTLHEARAARAFGIAFETPRVDLAQLRSWKDGVVRKLTQGLAGIARSRGVRHLRGRARFEGPGLLRCRTEDGDKLLRAPHVILASGSRPTRLPGLPDDPRIVDSAGALPMDPLPQRLLVVGGGYIGLELGTVHAALGAEVTLVELEPQLLPGVDEELVQPLEARCRRDFAAIHLRTGLEGVEAGRDALAVGLESDGRRWTEPFDGVLVAIGRRPNSDALGLEHTKAARDEAGFVRVDPHRRTLDPSLHAIGDVAGEPMLAHKATFEGIVAAEDVAGRPTTYAPRAVPAVVFTDPEVAWCGLSEREAKAEGREVAVARFPWSASGRAATTGRSEGVTRWLIDPRTDRVLGMGVAGPGAGELVAEGVLALELGATAGDLALSIHPHPTFSETLMEAARDWRGEGVHLK